MSRKVRFEYLGAIDHVINRGNYRKWIFETGAAKVAFEKALWETCVCAGCILHAYVLMGNHFHLALKTPELVWELRLGSCLKGLEKTESDILQDAKSSPWKVAIATHLKTTMLCRNGWIAEHLSMGTESGVSRLCAQAMKSEDKETNRIIENLNAKFKE